MAWTPLKTWGVAPWPVGDANTFIRDNVKAHRNQWVGQKMFFDGSYAVNTGAFASYASHTNLCPVSPDEPTVMLVYISMQIVSTSGGPTGWNARIKNQAGTVISPTSYVLSNWTTFARMGVSNTAASTNPGFSVEMLVTGGVTPIINTYVQSVVWIAGTTGP